MSQEEFAKRVGISRGYLSDLERGVREMSLATLAVVCRKSGTTPNKLLGWP
jgi:transcriptional regulator with XRE-family HTH domain